MKRDIASADGLLALTTSASADGAWVLWLERTIYVGPDGKPSGKPEITSRPQQGFQNAALCQERLARVLENARKDESYTVVDDTLMHNESTGLSFSRYACLPDTVHPRGPKGK